MITSFLHPHQNRSLHRNPFAKLAGNFSGKIWLTIGFFQNQP